MVAFGASDAVQGAGMVVDAVKGVSSEGFNFIKSGFQRAAPVWGGVIYESVSLSLNLGSLAAKIPLVVGASDGIQRAKSLFGVVTSRWENASDKFGLFMSRSVNQMNMLGSGIAKELLIYSGSPQ